MKIHTSIYLLGPKFRKGRWLEAEINVLVSNCNRYQEASGCSVLDPVYGKDGRDKWNLLSEGINRPEHSVRTKIRSFFGVRFVAPSGCHTRNHDRNRRYSPAEDRIIVKELRKMKAIGAVGEEPGVKIDWRLISDKTKIRTAASCRQHWRMCLATHEDFIHNPNRFSRKQLGRMFKLVRDYILENRIQNWCEIPWEVVLPNARIPLLPHEMKQKLGGLLRRNFGRYSPLTFQEKIYRLKQLVKNIRIVPGHVRYYDD